MSALFVGLVRSLKFRIEAIKPIKPLGLLEITIFLLFFYRYQNVDWEIFSFLNASDQPVNGLGFFNIFNFGNYLVSIIDKESVGKVWSWLLYCLFGRWVIFRVGFIEKLLIVFSIISLEGYLRFKVGYFFHQYDLLVLFLVNTIFIRNQKELGSSRDDWVLLNIATVGLYYFSAFLSKAFGKGWISLSIDNLRYVSQFMSLRHNSGVQFYLSERMLSEYFWLVACLGTLLLEGGASCIIFIRNKLKAIFLLFQSCCDDRKYISLRRQTNLHCLCYRQVRGRHHAYDNLKCTSF